MSIAESPRMFLAHLPAGYLLTRRLERRWSSSRWVPLGLGASVLPDLDLVRFYLVDHRRVHHHAYWTHLPAWWFLLGLLWFAVARWRGSREWLRAGVVFFANVFLHLALDTMVGDIRWLAPFSDRGFGVFSVPARHAWWVANFLLHWTMLFELAIAIWAARELLERQWTPVTPGSSRAAERARSELA